MGRTQTQYFPFIYVVLGLLPGVPKHCILATRRGRLQGTSYTTVIGLQVGKEQYSLHNQVSASENSEKILAIGEEGCACWCACWCA